MSAFGRGSSKTGQLIHIDDQRYDLSFSKTPCKLQYGRLSIPHIFLPSGGKVEYDGNDFNLVTYTQGKSHINRKEYDIECKFKLICFFKPELAIPKIFYFFRPITALQCSVLYITKQLFGISDYDQTAAFVCNNKSYINNFQNLFTLLCDFYKNSKFTLETEGIDDNFQKDIYLSFIEYLSESITQNQYLPDEISQYLPFNPNCTNQGFTHEESKSHKDATDFFKGQAPLPNVGSISLGFCIFCENFTPNGLFKHWHQKQSDLDYCQNKFFTAGGQYKCNQCSYLTNNRLDFLKHRVTFCTKNTSFCSICEVESASCQCTKARVNILQKLQGIFESAQENPKSIFHQDNITKLSLFLGQNKTKLLETILDRLGDAVITVSGDPTPTREPLLTPDLSKYLDVAFDPAGGDTPRSDTHTSNTFKCFCGASVPNATMQVTREHLRTHKIPFRCTRCSYSGRTVDDILSHLRTHEQPKIPRKPCSYPVRDDCMVGGTTSAANEVVHDLLYHTTTYEAFNNWVSNLHTVQLTAENPLGPATDNSRLPPTDDTPIRKDHKRTSAPQASPTVKHPPASSPKFQRHANATRPDIDLDSWSLDEGGDNDWHQDVEEEKIYPCENDRCKAQGISFDSPEQLQVHIDERHSCPECSFSNMRDSILLQHILSHRTAEKNFHCSYCKASFTTKMALTKHINGTHNLQCNICNEKNFSSHEILQLHRESCNKAAVGVTSRDQDPVIQLANLMLASCPEQHEKISSLIATQIRNTERQLNPKKFLTKKGLYVELPSFSPSAGRSVPSHRLKNLPQFHPTLGRDRDNLRNHLQLTKVMTSLRQLCNEFSLDEATAVSIFLQTCSDEVISTLNALSPVDMTSSSLETILHTLRDVYFAIDVESLFLSSSNIPRLTNEDLRSYYIRIMNLLKLASYHLPPSQRPDWVDESARSQFLKHVPSDFAAMTREEEVKRGKRYGGQDVFANYLEYIKATRKKNDQGIYNLRDDQPNTPNQRQTPTDTPQDTRQGRGRTNNIRRGQGRGRTVGRGGRNTPRGRGRYNNTYNNNRYRQTDQRDSHNNNFRTSPHDRPPRQSQDRYQRPNDGTRGTMNTRSRPRPNGPTSRLFVDAIRKSLNLAPTDIVCYLCGKGHISRNCDIYKGVRVQEAKCQSCLRFFHPTDSCQSRFRSISNKEE